MERLKVHRLDQMRDETGVAAATKVFVLPEAAERDAFEAVSRRNVLHDIHSAAVGQADVRDQEIELLPLGGINSFLDRAGRRHDTSETGQQLTHDVTRVGVIFNEQDALLLWLPAVGRGE